MTKQIFPLKRAIVFPVNNGIGGQMVFLPSEFGLEYHGYTPNPANKTLNLQISVTHIESNTRAYLVKSFLVTENGFEGALLNNAEIETAVANKRNKKTELDIKQDQVNELTVLVENLRYQLSIAEIEQADNIEDLRKQFSNTISQLDSFQKELEIIKTEYSNLIVPSPIYEHINKYADVIKWFTPEGVILDEYLPYVFEIELMGVKVKDLINTSFKLKK